MIARAANQADSSAIARIYNQGIEDRVATFETRFRSTADVEKWFDGIHPIVVVEEAGQVTAFASTSTYRARECYAGIAECSVYVTRDARGRGVGKVALDALFDGARSAGFHKLVARVFAENERSLKMLDKLGFRRVGVYYRHGQLEGVWKDVIIVEKLL
jgi:L-amino acid N-acyltransferase YncA